MALRRAEPGAERGDEHRFRFVSGLPERGLEVGLDDLPKLRVGDGALDELVETAPGRGQLLRRPHPGLGCRRKRLQELGQPYLIVVRHVVTLSPDGEEASDLPSSHARSLARQREILLAIVPEAMSSAAPMLS